MLSRNGGRSSAMKLSAAIRTAIQIVILAMLAGVQNAAAQDRLALVIGINKYDRLPPLKLAANDAQAVGEALRRIGFGVDLAIDVDRRDFNRALSNFLNKVTPGAIVYFHYSGHGITIDNDSFLIPADMEVPRSGDREFVRREAIALSGIIDSFKDAQARARVIVVDACRENPFAQSGVRSIGGSRAFRCCRRRRAR